ncbi:MAG TPA: hypothetical protein VHV83_21775, partial [Armatimonadota bacterium]|nr:hypothetical protein [Armatimonadota bacterium]
SRTEVKVESDGLELSQVNGEPIMAKARVIKPHNEYTLLFTGEYQDSAWMPTNVQAELTVKIAREE